ncbi:unnamed protein product [Peniophora sp. CBMAI 1063]|nr:unnamed protein product [Peniophora sp. CBMAI 1063]
MNPPNVSVQHPAANNTALPVPTPSVSPASTPSAPCKKLPKFKKNKGVAAPQPASNTTATQARAPSPPTVSLGTPQPTPPSSRAARTIPAGYKYAVEWGQSILFEYNTDYMPPYVGEAVFNGEVADDGLFHAFEYIRQPMLYDELSPQLLFTCVPRCGHKDTDEFHAAWHEDWDEERLLPVAEQKNRRVARDKTLLGELIKVGFFSRKKVHDVERMRVHDLKNNYQEAVTLLQEVWHKGSLKKGDAGWEVLEKMRLPGTIVSTMWKAWARMHWFGVLTDAEAEMCHRVYQCTALEVDGWLDIVASFLRLFVRQRPNHPLYRRLSLGPSECRGAIFAGDDIDAYHAVYSALKVPTYVNIARADLDSGVMSGIKFSKPDALRCSSTISIKLSTIKQKTLPFMWYPPLQAPWAKFEAQACGYAPHAESEETFKPADVVLSLKRKLENVDQNKKRIRLAQEVQQERRDEAFHRVCGDIGTSRERYMLYAQVLPAFRHQFDRLSQARPKQVLAHARLCAVNQKGEGILWSYLPPWQYITGGAPKRQARMLVNITHALPILLLRIKLAENNKNIMRFRGKGWRKFAAKVVTKEELWGEKGGKMNGLELLGGEDFEELRKLPDGLRMWGKLPCGHDAMEERLMDEQLRGSLCYSLNQWLLLFALCDIASPDGMEAARIPELSNKGSKHRVPDLMDHDREKNCPVLKAARNIAMLSKPINRDGWPEPWAPDTLNVKDRRKWLKSFAMLLASAKDCEFLDSYTQRRTNEAHVWDEWALGNLLRDVNSFQPLPPEREESLEDHLMLRYMLMLLKSLKQWPIEFMDRPRGGLHKCVTCHEEDQKKCLEERGTLGEQDMVERFEEEWDLSMPGEGDLSDEN